MTTTSPPSSTPPSSTSATPPSPTSAIPPSPTSATPPSPTSAVPLSRSGTPIHVLDSTRDKFSSKYENRHSVLTRLGYEMAPFIVGPISADAFLKYYLPPPPPDHPSFKEKMFQPLIDLVDQNKPEKELYEPFIRSVTSLSSIFLANTSSDSAKVQNIKFPYELKPDCSVYDIKYRENTPRGGPVDLPRVDFVIEFKLHSDPFGKRSKKPTAFTAPRGEALINLGQLTAYATSILSAQYRTHMFMVLIVGKYARLIRWDRSGAVFTKPIMFNEESHLFDFFIRYDLSDREARGHDVTVCPASSGDVKSAKEKIPGWPAGECLDVTISDKHFIIPSPEPTPKIPVGRWTRVSLAYDKQEARQVILKDSWRILLEGIISEGEIYRILRDKKVPNIPTHSLSEDVGNATFHESQTNKILKDESFEFHNDRSKWKLTSHRHYRIVLRTIGKKLESFSCTREFVKAMSAALKAHEAAYGAGVLHRDISPGNILIFGEGERSDPDDENESRIDGGMLIDWDLSKVDCKNDEHSTSRRHARTGTWQFIAADLIMDSHIQHTFAHDLESFFWVLLWIVLTRVTTGVTSRNRSHFMHSTMNPQICDGTGGDTRLNCLSGPSLCGEPVKEFRIDSNRALRDLVINLKEIVADRYINGTRSEGLNVIVYPPAKRMQDYRGVVKAFDTALSRQWPNSDKAVDCGKLIPTASTEWASCSGSKRSRITFESGQTDSDQPPSKRQA